MIAFTIRPIQETDHAWITRFIRDYWEAEIIVAHGAIYHPADLPGFVAMRNSHPVGLVTYSVADEECEIVSLNSLRPSIGIGTALVDAVKEAAVLAGCRRLWLITTNDNLDALRFYQKRGFELVAVHRDAVHLARQVKPIPLIGDYGIPIRDEVELELSLG
jgi:N-acetylglutamate synthase-like GNAT family acetyltransferase